MSKEVCVNYFCLFVFLYAFVDQKDCAHVTLSLGNYDIMNQDCLPPSQ